MAPLFSGNFMADVARSIRVCCGGQSDKKALDRLALFAARIVQQRLSGRILAAARARDVTIEQQALSVVSQLFIGEPPNIGLCQALQEELKSDDLTLFLKFQAVVVRTATQELFHRWSEIDPQSAKLWRNLNRAIKKDPRLSVFPFGKPEYVTLASEDDADLKRRLIEFDNIKTSLQAVGDTDISLSDRIVDLLTNEASSDECIVARIEDLFKAFRESIFSQIRDEIWPEADISYQNPFMKIAIERATESARILLEDCLEKYKENGKLESETCNKLAQAILEMVNDCADGGSAMSYLEYVQEYLPNLNDGNYHAEYRTRFEYLAKQVKKEFFDTLRKELGE